MDRNLSHQMQTTRLWGRRLLGAVEKLDLWRLLEHGHSLNGVTLLGIQEGRGCQVRDLQ